MNRFLIQNSFTCVEVTHFTQGFTSFTILQRDQFSLVSFKHRLYVNPLFKIILNLVITFQLNITKFKILFLTEANFLNYLLDTNFKLFAYILNLLCEKNRLFSLLFLVSHILICINLLFKFLSLKEMNSRDRYTYALISNIIYATIYVIYLQFSGIFQSDTSFFRTNCSFISK